MARPGLLMVLPHEAALDGGAWLRAKAQELPLDVGKICVSKVTSNRLSSALSR